MFPKNGNGGKKWQGEEEEGMELAGSTDRRAWASTASVNLTPTGGGDDRYLDPRYAASGESLSFDNTAEDGGDYAAVSGGQRLSDDGRR